jgi:hypothetical protein
LRASQSIPLNIGVCIHALLVLIAAPRVGLRPGRIEPCAIKRRANNFPLMTKPRKEARAEVREHGHPKKKLKITG